MALQEQAISVPIVGMMQKESDTSGPVGRLKRLVNAVADKWGPDGGNIRVTKRPAFSNLSRTVNDVTSGANISSSGISAPTLLAAFGESLVAVDRQYPYVYSGRAPAFERWPKTIITNTVSTRVIQAGSDQLAASDSAPVGNVVCFTYVPTVSSFRYAMFVDVDGVVVRSPVSVATGGRIKVVSDGTYFYVFTDAGTTTVTATLFDVNGSLVATGTVDTLAGAADTWDITYNSHIGVCLARPLGSSGGLSFSVVSRNGSGLTVANYTNASVLWQHTGSGDFGGGFLVNASGSPGVVVLACVSGAGNMITVYTLNSSAAIQHTYSMLSIGSPEGIANFGGYLDGTGTVYLSFTLLGVSGGAYAPLLNELVTVSCTSGGATATKALLSAAVASRMFQLNGIPLLVAYYASVPTEAGHGVFGTVNQVGQPTFFVVRADTQEVVGRLFHGSASMDYTAANWTPGSYPGPGFFQLPTPYVLSGYPHVPLSVVSSTEVSTSSNQAGTISVFKNAVGVTDVAFGAPGLPVQYQGELLIPGPMAWSFDGAAFVSSNIELDPEQPSNFSHSSGGPFTAGEVYGYVIVYETRTKRGRRVQSGSSINFQYTVVASSSQTTFDIPTLRITTHDDVIISVYRTAWVNGQQGTTHYKITDDLSPLLNNPLANTVSFTDDVDNTTVLTGEVLYGGSGSVPESEGGGDGQSLDYCPAPAFSCGFVLQNLVFLFGYDGELWFSFPPSTDRQLAFNEDLFRMSMPTPDPMVAGAALDSRAIVFCERSVWYVDGGAFLDATGAGTIPTPQQLPITHGGTQFCAVVPAGVIYYASSGGFYLLGRDLSSTYVGGAVEDEPGVPTAVAVDQSQRVHFMISSGNILVYDINFGGWFVWTPPSFPAVAATYQGKLAYADGTDVLVTAPGVADTLSSGAVPITSTYEFAPMSFADAQMVWELALLFSAAAGSLTVALTYDLDYSTVETFPAMASTAMDVDGSGGTRLSLQPANPECSFIQLTLTDSFPSAPAGGFTLEKIEADVGVMPEPHRGSQRRRVGP